MLNKMRVNMNLLIYRIVMILLLLFCVGISIGSVEVAYNSMLEQSVAGPVRFFFPIILASLIIVFILLLFN